MSCFARLVLCRLRLGGRDFVVDPAQISNWSSMTLLLKPSEYKGDKGTAVAGRVVIMVTQEVKMKESKSLAASPPGKGKGRGKQAGQAGFSAKLELHLAGTDSINEVVFVEAWGENATQLGRRCSVGDLIAITGASVISTAQMYSTSRLPYHLRVKGAIGTLVLVQKLEAPPWTNVPLHHPLVPLGSLERVKDKQQICVAAQIAENPGSMERDTVNGRMLVCNAIIQQGGTKVRCAFWRDHAEKLASFQTGACVLLYQVLAEKKKEGSWEVGSWRGTQILECPEDLAKSIQADLMQPSDCRMLTLVPTRNWKECEAVPTTLSSLVATIVPGQLRKLNTVFVVSGLQIMGLSSVRSETDDWILPSCATCKRAFPCPASGCPFRSVLLCLPT